MLDVALGLGIIAKLRNLFCWAAVIGSVASVLAWNNVSTDLTEADRIYIRKIIGSLGLTPPQTYEQQINTVLAVQGAVLTMLTSTGDGIPLGMPREPKDFYKARSWPCYDTSRTIEKILSYLHMKVRHVSVYSLGERKSALDALVSHGTSHALSEVLTKRGWMAVGSVRPWIGLTKSGRPVDVAGLATPHMWSEKVRSKMDSIFRSPFVRVIGLYSRHGQFYSPYLPLPDVNYRQLLYNF